MTSRPGWDSDTREKQMYCYQCGKQFEHVRYQCPTCREYQCSEECRREHIEWMDNL